MTTPRYEWQPTTAEIAAAAGISPAAVIRFDHNTSPFSSSWTQPLLETLAAHLNEYPGASYTPLRTAAAQSAGVDPAWVVPGAGIDELILLCGRAFLRPGDVAVGVSPTYPLYRIATTQSHADWRPLHWLPPAFTTIDGDLPQAASTAALTWICTPNNPTGRDVAAELIEAVLDTAAIVVVDAAYAEFAGDYWAPRVQRYANLIVLYTLSKAYGLAGLRVGYALAHPDLRARLDAVRPPGSITTIAAAAGEEALRTIDPATAVSAIAAERDRLTAELRVWGLDVLPSRANFVLCRAGDAAHAIEEQLRLQGLVVRSYREEPLQEHLRITVRSPAENDRLLTALRSITA